MSVSRLVTVLVLSVSAAASMAVSATPATAAVPGLELVWSAPATPSSATTRAAAAGCPSGKQVIGAFAFTTNTRDVVITALIPTTSGVLAVAHEDQEGTDDNWLLTVQAMCANPVPGRTIVSTSSASTSANKQQTTVCPAGTRMLTGGWSVGGDGAVFLNQVAPAADLSSLSITGMEDANGTAANWGLTTYAVCANPLPGQFTRTATSPMNSADKSVVIVCDPGQQRLSAGWSLIGDGNGTPAGRVLAQPGSSGTGWYELTAREDYDYSGSWYAVARVVCVTV